MDRQRPRRLTSALAGGSAGGPQVPLPVLDLSAFAHALPRRGALLALDLGEKRIGVAVSDVSRLIASSLATIARTKFAADADWVFKYFEQRQCVGIVIGLPLNMDGGAGPSAQAARAFARNLVGLRDTAVLLWDERLSTSAVTRTLIEADASRKRRGEVVDKLAAAYMLQGALDAMQERAAHE